MLNSASEISVSSITPFFAGQTVEIVWTCSGPSNVRLVLCKGSPCTYYGSEDYLVERLLSYTYCDYSYTWSSTNSLASGSDYHFCVEDSENSSVLDCAISNITAGQISVSPITPFFAGQTVAIAWTCNGPSSVSVVFCKGAPCTYSGSSQYHVQNLYYNADCDHSYTWSSTNSLASGSDYQFCVQDCEASSVLGCSVANITAGQISVSPITPFFAGQTVEIAWTCNGPSSVSVVFCKGAPCIYSGSSQYHVQNLDSNTYCDHSYTWSSTNSLASGSDYQFCVQDYEASSVLGCSVANITAGQISVSPIKAFAADRRWK